MAVKTKAEDGSDELEWNVENEVQLFLAMNGHKPVGVTKYFQMLCIKEKMELSVNKEFTSKAIWDHLNTMYDLQALDDCEQLPFPNTETDFCLPEAEFATLMKEKVADPIIAVDEIVSKDDPESEVKREVKRELQVYKGMKDIKKDQKDGAAKETAKVEQITEKVDGDAAQQSSTTLASKKGGSHDKKNIKEKDKKETKSVTPIPKPTPTNVSKPVAAGGTKPITTPVSKSSTTSVSKPTNSPVKGASIPVPKASTMPVAKPSSPSKSTTPVKSSSTPVAKSSAPISKPPSTPAPKPVSTPSKPSSVTNSKPVPQNPKTPNPPVPKSTPLASRSSADKDVKGPSKNRTPSIKKDTKETKPDSKRDRVKESSVGDEAHKRHAVKRSLPTRGSVTDSASNKSSSPISTPTPPPIKRRRN